MALTNEDIAGRLHDGPVQELTAAQLFLDVAVMELRKQHAPGLEDGGMLERGMSALRSAIDSTRAIMQELLEDDGGDP